MQTFKGKQVKLGHETQKEIVLHEKRKKITKKKEIKRHRVKTTLSIYGNSIKICDKIELTEMWFSFFQVAMWIFLYSFVMYFIWYHQTS